MNLALFFSLAAAIAWGASDYLAGLYSRRYSILAVLLVAQIAGLAVLLAAVPFFPSAAFTLTDLLWGVIAGTAAAVGFLLLIQGFRVGLLSVVSPVSALGTAIIPLLAGFLLGERTSTIATIGLFTALVAIWLVSRGSDDVRSGERSFAAGFWYGMSAGVCFAVTLLALAAADFASGIWPAFTMLGALVVVIAGALIVRRQRINLDLTALPGIAAIGMTGAFGVIFFVLATRLGLVSIAAVISSMSPAFTVFLARIFMGEVLSWQQVAGLLTAVAALALIGAN